MSKKEIEKTPYQKWTEYYDIEDSDESKEDYDVVEDVYEAYRKAKTHRENSCFWGTKNDDDSGSNRNWSDHWDKQEKAAIGWSREMSSEEGFQSNVKSPMTTGRIESMVHKLERLDLGWNALPANDEDYDKAQVASALLTSWTYRADVKKSFSTIWKDLAIHGTAFGRLYYKRESRKVSVPSTKVESKEDKEKVKEGKALWEEKQKVTYDDLVLEPIPIRDLYPEPGSLDLHGNYKCARRVVYKRIMNYRDFLSAYANNPNAKNLDKVKPCSALPEDDEVPFYDDYSTVSDGNSVVVLELEDCDEDKHCVIGNGIPVLEEPLPYIHKELSFYKFYAIELPHEFYGIGIPDYLMDHQAAEEIMLNLIYDYVYRSINIQYLVDQEMLGDLTQQYLSAGNQFIGVASNGRPVGTMIQQLVNAPINFDVFRVLDVTSRNATLATQIDPSQMNLIQQNVTATATAINKENTDSFLGSLLQHISFTLNTMGRHAWAIMQQKYSVPRVEKTLGKDGEPIKKEYREIRLVNKKVVEEDKKILVKEHDGISLFKAKPEYLNTKEDLDIIISPESLQIKSKGLEQQRAMENFAQMMPFSVDPKNKQQVAAHPNPLFDANVVAADYVKKMDINPKVLISGDMLRDYDIALAQDHVNRILRGEIVVGRPGKSEEHLEYERDVLSAIEAIKSEMEKAIEEDVQKWMGVAPIDPMTGMPQPYTPSPGIEKMYKDYSELYQALSDHIALESLPVGSDRGAKKEAGAMEMPQVGGMDGNLVPPSQGSGGALPMPQNPSMADALPGMLGQ